MSPNHPSEQPTQAERIGTIAKSITELGLSRRLVRLDKQTILVVEPDTRGVAHQVLYATLAFGGVTTWTWNCTVWTIGENLAITTPTCHCFKWYGKSGGEPGSGTEAIPTIEAEGQSVRAIWDNASRLDRLEELLTGIQQPSERRSASSRYATDRKEAEVKTREFFEKHFV